MTIYDAAMAIVVVLGMVRGAWRGFTWQMASIVSLVLGYTVARSGSALVASYMPGQPEMQRLLAMAAIYVSVSAGVFGVAWMIRGTLRRLKFDAFDRHLGMMLGGLEGVGVGLLITLFLVGVAPGTRQPIFSSPTGHVVGAVMNHLGPVLPAEVRKVLAPHWDASATVTTAIVDAQTGPKPPAEGTKDLVQAPAGAVPPAVLPPVQEVAETRRGAPAAMPSLPPLEAAPEVDSTVKQAGLAGASPAPAAAAGTPSPTRRAAQAVISGIVDEGRKEIEQAVTQALDTQTAQPAGSLSELVNRDKQRIKDAAQAAARSRSNLGNQVKERLNQGQQQLRQAVTNSVDRAQQQVGQAISDSIDEQLRKLGGLEPAPVQKGRK